MKETNVERLERVKNTLKEIDEYYEKGEENTGQNELYKLLVHCELDYLVKQAERVENLLKMNDYLRKQREENERLRAELKTVKEDNMRLLATWDNHYSTM